MRAFIPASFYQGRLLGVLDTGVPVHPGIMLGEPARNKASGRRSDAIFKSCNGTESDWKHTSCPNIQKRKSAWLWKIVYRIRTRDKEDKDVPCNISNEHAYHDTLPRRSYPEVLGQKF